MEHNYLLLAILLPVSAVAQPTYNLADAPVIGTEVEVSSAATFIAQPQTGANQTWNYSSAGVNTTTQLVFDSPANSDYVSDFPTATLRIQEGSSETFVSVLADGYYQNGVVVFGTPIITSNSYRQIAYPTTMGTQWTDPWTTVGAGTTANGTVTCIANGYGTLQLPWGTVQNVLRVRCVDVSTQTTPSTVLNTIDTTVYFYKSGFPFHVLRERVRRNTIGGVAQAPSKSVVYATQASVVGVQEYVDGGAGLEVFPNPASSTFTVNATSSGARTWVEVLDTSGRTVLNSNVQVGAPGILQWTLDASSWEAGLYMIRLHGEGNGGIAMKKLLVN